MAVGNGSPGVSKLANVISGRSRRHAESIEDDLKLEFGTILAKHALQTDSFPIAIPKGEYTVLRHYEGHPIHKGTRVLVAWVGDEAVVLGEVVSSSRY